MLSVWISWRKSIINIQLMSNDGVSGCSLSDSSVLVSRTESIERYFYCENVINQGYHYTCKYALQHIHRPPTKYFMCGFLWRITKNNNFLLHARNTSQCLFSYGTTKPLILTWQFPGYISITNNPTIVDLGPKAKENDWNDLLRHYWLLLVVVCICALIIVLMPIIG